jgi:4-hydroxy-tetrahydrodipicolinate reductase
MAAPNLDLVAKVGREGSVASFVDARASVVVDFTHPDAVMGNLKSLIESDIHAVVGTTGFDAARFGQVSGWLARRPNVGVLIAPNFAIGAVLAMNSRNRLRDFFSRPRLSSSITPTKWMLPPGQGIARRSGLQPYEIALGMRAPDATSSELDGARGANVAGVRVHSVQLVGLVAHQEVLFGSDGETLTIRHDSTDRSSFVSGVLLAVRAIGKRLGLTIGIDVLLDL